MMTHRQAVTNKTKETKNPSPGAYDRQRERVTHLIRHPEVTEKYFSKFFWIFGNFSFLRALDARKSTVSIVCYRRMGHGMGQGVTHTATHIIFGSKSKKNHRFLIENGGFLVAEAGLEPTTSGL